MAASEFETVEDEGFVFKVRKKCLEEILAAPQAVAEEEPVVVVPEEVEKKKKKRLLTLKSMYEAELKAWEKLEAATAVAPQEPPSTSENALPRHDPHTEMLKELKIEVENVEQYIKRLQDHVLLAESTYKLLVKELREDANFRPADQIILALTGQGTTTTTTTTTTAPATSENDNYAVVT